ncbi:glycogen debranching protein GlgX [Aliivibrio sp. S4TY2]|uniref:glycogen debranching protein GlgX n=1 Tax=unclassified Aliivibrio TaxID=2645654 RepID=UPI00237878D0|nr:MULTISPECIES: glycogen debranching protein GlgX [unclassified Aliivibrio]MDD9156272.1 glycogen debranching protein GlgX [Aliivibrio sp. S4TY2]MDD9160619.1 glycogen debranching protein GlgX [Aliivibrio sp. S4TY1]MDD9163979.1 glycogen debranching protein GlgX [Aliivibrio sp. S4MY2]MDD9168046.1 glycogen debranching protein GlgX [Aliivibrio sp. S4MY4]MDD9185176.1 glycogen debranching protein GlgX [Aliivibrio sp. S4MY3]
MNIQHAFPYPLGATLTKNGCNFSVHHASPYPISLIIFDDNGNHTEHPFTEEYGTIKYTLIDDVTEHTVYGFKIIQDNEALLLLDPYAKALKNSPHYQVPYTAKQSWTLAQCVVVNNDFDWQESQRPMIPRSETILLETHVKGFTLLNSDVEESVRGTYLGLADPANINHLKQQGITTVQLLPIAACMHEPHLLKMNMVNYWGYNPIAFMAPDPRYAKSDAVNELKTAIRELHKNNIEVILDVVYNHTAEGGNGGTTFNLKGLDQDYYLHHHGNYTNYTGCGNTLDITHQPSLNLIMDTLRYWVEHYHVDGFRFDLAATLGREYDQFNPNNAFFKAVAQDPTLQKVKLIAEPWDIGPNGYQVGEFPDGWNECSDKFRDTTKSFWRGEQNYLKSIATRIMGSRDLVSASRWPHKLPVNYVSYHDGFTLQDLVSYKERHNHANGEDNRDGHGDNRSDNYGVEGETTNSRIIALREKQKRNMITTLLFSFGIPHLLAADACSHTQKGNNNAYCQDSDISWVNWKLDKHADEFKVWLADIIQARQTHMVPMINAFSGSKRTKQKVNWYTPEGNNMTHGDWHRAEALCLHLNIYDGEKELLIMINQSNVPTRFELPKSQHHNRWALVCNTQYSTIESKHVIFDYSLSALSIAIFNAE